MDALNKTIRMIMTLIVRLIYKTDYNSVAQKLGVANKGIAHSTGIENWWSKKGNCFRVKHLI